MSYREHQFVGSKFAIPSPVTKAGVLHLVPGYSPELVYSSTVHLIVSII